MQESVIANRTRIPPNFSPYKFLFPMSDMNYPATCPILSSFADLLRLRSEMPAACHGVNQRWQSSLLTHSTTLMIPYNFLYSISSVSMAFSRSPEHVACVSDCLVGSHTRNPSCLTPSDFRTGACPSNERQTT